ncbi:mechanosensitive channel MscK [Halopseudomonas sp.]|uniref:mechanosensitive channel MscK n=1 Tax=Halopseudomonas sp. TaxID=2901191 RepID=UPI003569E1A3
MLHCFRPLLTIVLIAQLLFSGIAVAAIELNEAIEATQAKLEALAASSMPDTEKQELQEIYQNTIDYLQKSKATAKELEELQTLLDSAPEEIRRVRQRVDAIQPREIASLRSSLENQNLEVLEARLTEKVTTMFDWQNQLTAINSNLIAAQTRPERTQAQVTANQARSQAIAEQVRLLQRQADGPQKAARMAMLKAEQQSLQDSSSLLRQQLAVNSVLQDLASQRRSLMSQQIADIEFEIQALQDVINEKRLSQSEQTVSDTTAKALLGASNHELLKTQGSLNRRLSEELLAATSEVGELTRKNITTKQQIDSATQIENALEQQINVLEGSALLSRILHQQKQALPTVRTDTRIADRVADLRLREFELNQLREKLASPEAYLTQLLAPLPEAQRELLRDDIREVIASRSVLTEQLSNNISTLLSLAITLQINQRQLQQLSSQLRRTIDDQLFWVASSRPIDKAWVLALPAQLTDQFSDLQLQKQAKTLVATIATRWPGPALLGLLLLLYAWRRRRWRARLRDLNADVGHFRHDSARHTPKALGLTALIVLPMPVALSATGLLLMLGEPATLPALGAALLKVAIAWFVLHFLYRVLEPRGIAIRHFRWDEKLVERLHHLIRNVSWVLLPLVLVIALNAATSGHLGDDVIGRLTMLIGMLLLSVLLGHMMWHTEPLYHSRVLHMGATLLLVLAPLALAGMSFWGYHYTATRLADRFFITLYLIAGWMVLQGTVSRNLNVAGRRLAYQRALTKRQAATPRETQDAEMGVEVPEMDIRQINQQSLRLARLILSIIFAVLVYLTWADLLSAASYLESVTLWEYNKGTSDNPMMAPISAGDVLGALVIVVLTVTLARNLPGLLEILVLSRLNLRQGSSYAITTLLSYVIVSVGVVYGLSALGVSWNKLQWLVAALSVGLGFGLQEIFANFVSGLIILFERPIRIGDVVTIGDLSGTVNRIRIRATTITDFDRKEIIVPNKTFVTSHLINWSLSDTVTRVIIKVGVAYGSDLAKTRELLLQAASNNARVLDDPEPLVLFLSYSESTLDHELRVHVRELIDRNLAIDEINRDIDRLFAENGIEIAFRQLDVNLRTSAGLEKLISTQRAEYDRPLTDPDPDNRKAPTSDAGAEAKPPSPDSEAALGTSADGPTV